MHKHMNKTCKHTHNHQTPNTPPLCQSWRGLDAFVGASTSIIRRSCAWGGGCEWDKSSTSGSRHGTHARTYLQTDLHSAGKQAARTFRTSSLRAGLAIRRKVRVVALLDTPTELQAAQWRRRFVKSRKGLQDFCQQHRSDGNADWGSSVHARSRRLSSE